MENKYFLVGAGRREGGGRCECISISFCVLWGGRRGVGGVVLLSLCSGILSVLSVEGLFVCVF